MDTIGNISDLITLYKEQWVDIRDREKYKWIAVKQFQGSNFNPKSPALHKDLDNALRETKNLLGSGNYLPRKMLLVNAQYQPKIIRDALVVLFNETIELIDRVKAYRTLFIKATKKNVKINIIDKNKQNIYQDERAISVYLSLMYPEKYYLYKFEIYKIFCAKLNLDIPKKSFDGSIQNLLDYWNLCEVIKKKLEEDQDLINLYEKTLLKEGTYDDPKHNLLVQDFIYTFCKDFYKPFPNELVIPSKIYSSDDIKCPCKEIINFEKSGKADYIKQHKESIAIGKLGELFVNQQEKLRISKFKYNNSLEPKMLAGNNDYAGYDILSYNEDGTKRYIEVKTTQYALETPFYISDREVEFSKIHQDAYYLYRVYEFDKDSNKGKIEIIQGSLDKHITCPTQYKIVFEENDKQ